MDLSTVYMGMHLKNPIVHSSSPLSEDLGNIRRLEDCGAAAVVMYSLFEEQITLESQQLDRYLSYGTEGFAEARNYFPDMKRYHVGPDEYLERIRKAKEAVDIPVLGSLDGVSTGSWIDYAEHIEAAGADALELNLYYIPTDPDMIAADVEHMYIDTVQDVKKSVNIPVAVKLSPFFTNVANVARRLHRCGADALVLFNRFYQPDFDLEGPDVIPHLVLSTSYEMRLPLRWVAILFGRVPVDLAITSGVHTHEDVVKGVMGGAKVTMIASELLQNGIGRVTEMLEQLKKWMERHEYQSIRQMQGSMSQRNVAEPTAFERANYMKVLNSWRPDQTGRMAK